MKVYLLVISGYEDHEVVGVYATKELCEREILRRVYANQSLGGISIEEAEVIES